MKIPIGTFFTVVTAFLVHAFGRSEATCGGCTCDSAEKIVSCPGVVFARSSRTLPEDIEELTITGSLAQLKDRSFERFVELKSLMLSNLGISVIQPKAFTGLHKLTTLKLEKNAVSNWPGKVFDGLTQLEELYVDSKTKNKNMFDGMLLTYLPKLRTLKVNDGSEPYLDFDNVDDAEFTSDCLTGDCYKGCGQLRSELYYTMDGTWKEFKEHVYTVYLDLDGWGNAFKLNNFVYAQTVRLPSGGTLMSKSGSMVTIYTREFYMEKGRRYTLDNYDCKVRYISSANSKRRLILLVHDTVTIYAERLRYFWGEGFGDHDGNPCKLVSSNPPSLPKPSIPWVKLSTMCAKMLVEDFNDDASRETAKKMVDFSLSVLSAEETRRLSRVNDTINSVMQARSQIEALREQQGRYVPFLTKDTYLTLLGYLHEDGILYADKYDAFISKSVEYQEKVVAAKSMLSRSNGLTASSLVNLNNAQDLVEISKKTVANIRKGLKSAETEIDSARTAFLDGIDSYAEEQSAKLALDVLKSMGSIVKGAFMMMSGTPAAPAGAGDIMIGVAGLGQAFLGFYQLIKSLQATIAAINTIENSALNLAAPDAPIENYIKDLDQAAELRVRVIEWDNMVTEANALLSGGTMSKIRGSSGYKKALSIFATWGRELTEEIIRQTVLVRELNEKRIVYVENQKEDERLQEAIDRAESSQEEMEKLKLAVEFHSLNTMITLHETLRYYSLSYFYFQFREVGSNVKPSFRDTLRQLLSKVRTAQIDAVNSLSRIRGRPQGITQTVNIINSDNSDACEDYKSCPLSVFKETSTLVYELPPAHPLFRYYERVRVERIEVELVGATVQGGSGQIQLGIENAGEFTDRYDGVTYDFTSHPLDLKMWYNALTGEIVTPAEVHESFKGFFFQSSPFTTWTITLAEDSLTSVDLSGVTAVKFTVSGSAIIKNSPVV